MTVISTSAFYERATRDLGGLRARAEDLQASIGTGQRLARPSDDPVAAARLRSLSRSTGLAAADSAVTDRASADLTLADSALSRFADGVIRVQELAVQAANGTLNPAQRGSIAAELDQIHAGLIELANSRDSAGHALFGGESTGNAYAGSSYVGTASAGILSLGDGQSVVRGVTGPEFLNFTGPAGPTDLLTVISTLSAALTTPAADPTAAGRDALGALDSGLDSITTAQTVVGTRLNYLDQVTTRAAQQAEFRSDEEARVGGTDLASAISQLQQTMTVLEASQASFAKLSQLSLFTLLR